MLPSDQEQEKTLLTHVANGNTYAGIDSKAVLQYIQQQFFINGVQYNQLDEESAALFSNDYPFLLCLTKS